MFADHQFQDFVNLPDSYTHFKVDTKYYNLDDYQQAKEAYSDVQSHRNALKAKVLFDYEGKSTTWGCGGRAELLHDEIVTKMALDKHRGLHNLSCEEMEKEANRIVAFRADQTRQIWKK